ncbi:MAG: ERF family protein [Polaribacter sp.]
MSKQISINEKLFNLQQEIGTISKDSNNPFFKSKYFDINSLIKQLQPLLKKNKLLLLQPIEEDMVVSKLICIDGTGGVISALKLPEINDPQKLGSAITYYRRYTLASLLGLQAIDDDGNIASNRSSDLRDSNLNSEKPWLNVGTDNYDKAVKYLSDGGNLDNIKVKYRISKEVQNELAKL